MEKITITRTQGKRASSSLPTANNKSELLGKKQSKTQIQTDGSSTSDSSLTTTTTTTSTSTLTDQGISAGSRVREEGEGGLAYEDMKAVGLVDGDSNVTLRSPRNNRTTTTTTGRETSKVYAKVEPGDRDFTHWIDERERKPDKKKVKEIINMIHRGDPLEEHARYMYRARIPAGLDAGGHVQFCNGILQQLIRSTTVQMNSFLWYTCYAIFWQGEFRFLNAEKLCIYLGSGKKFIWLGTVDSTLQTPFDYFLDLESQVFTKRSRRTPEEIKQRPSDSPWRMESYLPRLSERQCAEIRELLTEHARGEHDTALMNVKVEKARLDAKLADVMHAHVTEHQELVKQTKAKHESVLKTLLSTKSLKDGLLNRKQICDRVDDDWMQA